MNFWQKLRKAVRNLFRRNNVESAFNVDIAVSSSMEEKLTLWSEMFEDHPHWKDLDKGKMTTNLPAAIASEIARLVTLEMKSEVTGSPRAEYLGKQYQSVTKKAREFTEYACALGGVALKPYVVNDRIYVSLVQHSDFYPVNFDSDGDVTSAVFLDYAYEGDLKYTRMEYHSLKGTTYTISNKVFVAKNKEIANVAESTLGREASLEDVADWAGIDPEVVIQNIEKPLFAYFRMPFANNIDPRSPMGVSVYAKATETIQEADRQWSEISWEFRGGELAVHGTDNLFPRDDAGKPIIPEGKERLFDVFYSMKDEFLKTFNPEFRDQSLYNGFNKILERVEFQCGLAYGTISDPNVTDKTATEVKQSRQRSFSTVADIQKALQDALDHLLYAMDTLATLYELAPDGEYEVSYYWDDSLIVDSEAQRLMDLQEVAAGIMQKWEYRVKWYGEDEDTAKQRLQESNDRTDDQILKFEDEEPPVEEGKAGEKTE